MMTQADPTPVGIVRPLDSGRPDPSVVDDDAGGDGGRRRRPWLRRSLAGLVVVVLLVGGYFFVSLYQVWSSGGSDQARPVDAIVVLGAAQYDGEPSPQLAARLDHTLRLWPEGYAPMIVATGGNRPGDRFTEAEAAASYLVEHGVPSEAIMLENEGASTYESLEAVATTLAGRGLDTVLIVTDPYHALRSRLIAEEVGLHAYVSPAATSVVTGDEEWKRNVREAGGVMIGRILGFDRL
jgi:uncharacterized SAM-binding protein YcdF (DUF218 family)